MGGPRHEKMKNDMELGLPSVLLGGPWSCSLPSNPPVEALGYTNVELDVRHRALQNPGRLFGG